MGQPQHLFQLSYIIISKENILNRIKDTCVHIISNTHKQTHTYTYAQAHSFHVPKSTNLSEKLLKFDIIFITAWA